METNIVAKKSGEVQDVLIKEGQQVKVGQLLTSIS